MFILGLTGSIGMGKTTAGRVFRMLGVPVRDADAEVHRLFTGDGDVVRAIALRFPGAVRDRAVDRRALAGLVFEDPQALRALEAIVHPAVRDGHRRFVAAMARRGIRLCVLDIPLLFETGAETLCDRIVVVSAPHRIQRLRVLRRPGMTEARFRSILARQLPDNEKKRRADAVVLTGLGRDAAFQALRAIVADAKGRTGAAWSPRFARVANRRPA